MREAITVVTLVYVLASCGHSSPETQRPKRLVSNPALGKATPDTTPRPKERFTLFYDEGRAKSGFPSPFAKGTVNGVPGVFLVDTGAMVHVLSKEFAAKLRIAIQKTTTSAVDSTNTKVRLGVMVGALGLGSFYDNKQEVFFVAHLPPSFSKNKIDGILSPQLLHKAGMSVLLDLKQPSLAFVDWQQFVRERKPVVYSGKRVTACVHPKKELMRVFAVDTQVAGKTVKLLLDSGAASTSLTQKVAQRLGLLAKARDAGHSSMGIGGKRVKNLVLSNAHLRLAGQESTHDLRIKRVKGGCPCDGALGMGILRGCQIAFGAKDVAMACGKTRP